MHQKENASAQQSTSYAPSQPLQKVDACKRVVGYRCKIQSKQTEYSLIQPNTKR